MHIELYPEKIIETVRRLRRRVDERFPDSGLGQIAGTLEDIAEEAAARSRAIRRPRIMLRVLLGVLLAVAGVVVVIGVSQIRLDFALDDGWELLQTAEAMLSAVVFLGAAVLFLVTLESRAKRREVLEAIEQLRVLAHVVDMHQLVKDPDRGLSRKIWQKIVILDRHTV